MVQINNVPRQWRQIYLYAQLIANYKSLSRVTMHTQLNSSRVITNIWLILSVCSVINYNEKCILQQIALKRHFWTCTFG